MAKQTRRRLKKGQKINSEDGQTESEGRYEEVEQSQINSKLAGVGPELAAGWSARVLVYKRGRRER